MVQSFVSYSIYALKLNLSCFIVVENVLSHMYVLPNVERIFSAKSFSFGNLSLLTNL